MAILEINLSSQNVPIRKKKLVEGKDRKDIVHIGFQKLYELIEKEKQLDLYNIPFGVIISKDDYDELIKTKPEDFNSIVKEHNLYLFYGLMFANNDPELVLQVKAFIFHRFNCKFE